MKLAMTFKRSIILVALILTLVTMADVDIFTTGQASGQVNITAPSIEGRVWLNSTPMTNESLKNKVYLVEFWTFGCYNCRNVEPYVKQWYQRYHSQGFEVIAVHSPEFAHEKNIENVKKYINKENIAYPVVLDNDFRIWKRFNNRYWPAMYLVDKKGIIRYAHFGEGRYKKTESMIQKLLTE